MPLVVAEADAVKVIWQSQKPFGCEPMVVVVVPDADLVVVGDLIESAGPPSLGPDAFDFVDRLRDAGLWQTRRNSIAARLDGAA